jgi:hypothetical protein
VCEASLGLLFLGCLGVLVVLELALERVKSCLLGYNTVR